LFLTVLGLLGFGLGAITRSSAGAIAAVLGLLFVPPAVVSRRCRSSSASRSSMVALPALT